MKIVKIEQKMTIVLKFNSHLFPLSSSLDQVFCFKMGLKNAQDLPTHFNTPFIFILASWPKVGAHMLPLPPKWPKYILSQSRLDWIPENVTP